MTRIGGKVAAAAGRVLDWAIAPVVGVTVAVRTNEPIAALTFDDGPDPLATPRLLELLDTYRAKATFFVIGDQAIRHPEIVERIRRSGHALGNHTWSHPSLPRITRAERERELSRPHEEFPVLDKLVRPPYGHFDVATWLDVRRLGLHPVAWSGHAKDWAVMDPEILLRRMSETLRPGAILLLHDRLRDWEDERFVDRTPLLQALEELLDAFRGRMQFVTVPELLSRAPCERQVWWKRGDDAWLEALKRAADG